MDKILSVHKVFVPRSLAMDLILPERVTSFDLAQFSSEFNSPTTSPVARFIIYSSIIDFKYVKNKLDAILSNR